MLTFESFLGLSPACTEIRAEVFMKEQGFREEVDALDAVAHHGLVYSDGIAVATARLIKKSEGHFVLGKIATSKGHRGVGIGTYLMENMKKVAKTQGATEILLWAQMHAVSFYEKVGFIRGTDIKEEEEVPHLKMKFYFN